MKDSNSQSVASQSASRWLASLAMMASTALAVPAVACPPDESEGESMLRLRPHQEQESEGVPLLRDLPLVGGQVRHQLRTQAGVPVLRDLPIVAMAQRGDSSSTVVMSHEVDGHTYEVRIEDGKTTAKVDGEELPAKQIRTTKGQIALLDEKGNVLHEFPQVDMKNGPLTILDGRDDQTARIVTNVPGGFGHLRLAGPDDNTTLQLADTNPPPVMMGITMSESSDEAGTGIVIDKVMEGLPAGKAGLQSGDKIIQLDGENIEGVMEFRESLADHKPGDEITLKLIRDKKEMDVKVKLEAYDAQTLEPFVAKIRAANAGQLIATPAEKNNFANAKRNIESAIKTLENAKLSDEARAAARQTLEKALKSLEEAQSGQQPQWWTNRGKEFITPGQPGVFVAPGATTAPKAWGDGNADELEKKLARLDEKLEQVMRRVEDMRGSTSAESADRATEALEKLRRENAEMQKRNAALQKKIEELQAKLGGN